MNATMTSRALTLADLEVSKSSSVWVRNNSNPKGNINMTMSDGMGNNIVVTVPVTWIPLDLTTQASKTGIISSPTFRRMLSMGLLTLVSEAEATEVMSDAKAQKEAQRVYSHAREASLDAYAPAEAKVATAESDGSVSGFAMQLSVASDLDEDQVMTMLRGNESTLTKADFKYIAETSAFGRVKLYCAERAVQP